MTFLETPIENLSGLGRARASLLQNELEIYTYEDLLLHFPIRHVDRTQITSVSALHASSPFVVLRGRISNLNVSGMGRSARLNALFSDATGSIILTWFHGIKWIQKSIRSDVNYLVMGKPATFNGHINIVHPELEFLGNVAGQQPAHGFEPVYSTTERMKERGLGTKMMAKLMSQLLYLSQGQIPENLPLPLLQKFRIPPRAVALHQIHFPDSSNDMVRAIQRMKFEELFFLQLDYQYAKVERQHKSTGRIFSVIGDSFNRFYSEKLPFKLTGAQKRVVREIRADMRSGHQMNRLLQGDVGSGKTLVALLCMLIAVDNNCQACLMAPTEILAQQHFATISKMLAGLDLHVDLLTGSTKTAEKRKVRELLLNGTTHILVGTHALIEDSVQFHDLGFVVIDEQHRFGVKQRSKLWSKSQVPPHILVMTATPIPRTLAMTIYGDLDCSVIDELPPGRMPIKTIHCSERERLKVFSFLHREIGRGRQIYVVYPLIEESEKADLANLMDGYESIVREFPLPQFQTSILHGRMTPDAKDYEMTRFKNGTTNIMVSTTVIEVGVDVPNATVMVIENADRFGLSQLHQLRGRVGRGGEQSYCILMTSDHLSATAKERLETMVSSSDGFRIAEVDLKLRGPGDLQGLQQSGLLKLRLADIVNDENIVSAARESVMQILQLDPRLERPEHACLQLYINKKQQEIGWSKIS